eukprot:Nk52_evm63s164 gene=Nk52_evmTU63s164
MFLHHRKRIPQAEYEEQKWTCGFCKRVNIFNSPTCAKCSQPRESAEKKKFDYLLVENEERRRRLFWDCISCGHENPKESTQCQFCDQNIEKSVALTEETAIGFKEWQCSSCLTFNSAAQTSCKGCSRLADYLEPVSVLPDWMCGQCGASNFGCVDTCTVCNILKVTMEDHFGEEKARKEASERYQQYRKEVDGEKIKKRTARKLKRMQKEAEEEKLRKDAQWNFPVKKSSFEPRSVDSRGDSTAKRQKMKPHMSL